MANSNLVQSVIKALDLLHTVSNAENGIRLNELADMFGMKKTTVHNLVRTLRARDYLTKDASNRFHVGPAVSELLINSHRSERLQTAGQVIRELSMKYPKATITFSELCGTEIFCRLRMSQDQPGLLQKPVAHTFQPYVSATSNCFLAFTPSYNEILEKYPFEEYGLHKWKSQDELEKTLCTIRQHGWYLQRHTENSGLRMAIPAGEHFVLGINLANCSEGDISGLIESVTAAAKKIAG
jgi:DNA-binding IclR family transcriptional regulator